MTPFELGAQNGMGTVERFDITIRMYGNGRDRPPYLTTRFEGAIDGFHDVGEGVRDSIVAHIMMSCLHVNQ